MIRCEGLVKRYGKTLALDHLDLHIGEGEIHGFVGPNGAGKTTAMKILATLMRPTQGNAFVGGVNVVNEPQKVRALVGYMPDFFGVYDNLKVWEYLDFYAGCSMMEAGARGRRIDELLELTALLHKREAYVDHLSRGMKQRLCLARALMHDPKLLILDEPASGMDPRARAQMRDILREVGRMGKTVLISSHILPELSELCTSMTIMEKGKTIYTGSAQEMKRRMRASQLIIRFSRELNEAERSRAHQAVAQLTDLQLEPMQDGAWRLPAQAGEDADTRLLRALVLSDLPVAGFSREKTTLEKVFMEVTQHAQSDS